MTLHLRGTVGKGYGVADRNLQRVLHLIRERTGNPEIISGTLNVYLSERFLVEPQFVVTAEEYYLPEHDHREELRFLRCWLQGVECWIMRPETHEVGEGAGTRRLELMSHVKLREHLGLEDGDQVVVKVDETPSHRDGAEYLLRAKSGAFKMTTFRAGITLDGDPSDPEGRRVESSPSSGGKARSKVEADGSFKVELSGDLHAGTSNEPRVLGILFEAFRAHGRIVQALPDARDDRGQDGRLQIGADDVWIQIVTVPDTDELWQELHREGSATVGGELKDAVAFVRSAIERKGPRHRGDLVVLDATHFGAPVTPRLVEAYRATHGDPEEEYGLWEAWIVGASKRSTFRLGGP